MKRFLLVILAVCLFGINQIMGQYQWITQPSGTSTLLTSVFFISKDTGYVSSEYGFVIKTVNGGQNWEILTAESPWGSLYFKDYLHGFGTGEGCILKTNNGAVSWDTAYKNPNIFGFVNLFFPNKKNGYCIGLDNYMGSYVLKTVNGGSIWDTIFHMSDDWANYIYFKDSLTGFMGGTSHYIYKTTDGGFSWTPFTLDAVYNVSINSIYFPTQDSGYAVSDGKIYRTINGGDTWSEVSNPIPAIIFSVWFTDANHGWVVGGDGITAMNLYKTINGGTTWTQDAVGTQQLYSVVFPDSTTGYTIGTNGTILKRVKTDGVEDNSRTENNISIYPNPAGDKIFIEFGNEDINSDAQMSVYSTSGQLLMQKKLNKRITEIDISCLDNVAYFMKTINGNEVKVVKLIKK